MKKGKFAGKTVAFFILQLFLFCFNAFSGEMIQPRIIYQIKSKYFDILYSKESCYTAKLMADNADAIYEKALTFFKIPLDQPFSQGIKRVPLVISPDSDVFSVNYSFYPYNRIVIMEAVPDSSESYENELFRLLYSQLLKATAASIKSPFNQKVADFFSWWQPVEVLNLPFSSLDGVSFVDDILSGKGEYNDGFFLQILSQAKIEGKFPSWLQASAASNAYTSDNLTRAASAAFAAYLIQAYGIERYSDFITECGKLKIGKLTRGIFKDVYGEKLTKVWKDFEDSVPLPENLLDENISENIFFKGNAGTYEYLLNTPYGFVFFDSFKNEVILAKKFNDPILSNITGQTFQKYHLFYAKKITKLELSPDGRYLLVCCNESHCRSNFYESRVRFFDLKYRLHLPGHLKMRDAAFISLKNGKLAVAGISTKDKYSSLQVYSFEKENPFIIKKKLMFSKSLASEVCLQNLSYCGEDSLICLMSRGGEKSLLKISGFSDGSEVGEKEYKLFEADKSSFYQIRNLRFQHFSDFPLLNQTEENEKNPFFTLEYVNQLEKSFTRTALISCSRDFEPEKIYVQKADLSGGIYNPVFADGKMYFAKKMLFDQKLEVMEKGLEDFFDFALRDFALELKNQEEKSSLPDYDFSVIPSRNELALFYPHKKYFPFSYADRGSMYPFFPITSFDYDKDVVLWPGLGFTYETNSDPFSNNTVKTSASFGFSQYGIYEISENLLDELDRIFKNFRNFQNDVTFAAMVKNTSTPFDLRVGSLFGFQPDGRYRWNSIAGAEWEFPFLYNMNSLKFSLIGQYIASSTYIGYDESSPHPDLSGWPSLSDMYHFSQIYASVNYSNIHQEGTSIFEKYGFSAGFLTVTDWDYANLSADSHDATKFTIGTKLVLDIPRLLPFANYKGLVYSLPSEYIFQMFATDGTALKTGLEFLLIGKEILNGIAPVFISRTGLKAGYTYSLKYDSRKKLPDVRDFKEYMNFLTRAEVEDEFYLKVLLDIVPVAGTLSNHNLRGEGKFSYYPRKKDFGFAIALYIDFE